MIKRKIIPDKFKIIYYVMLTIGLIVFIIGTANLIIRIQYDNNGTRTEAEVVDIVTEGRDYIVIEYETEDSVAYDAKVYNYKSDIEIGDHIGIKYLNDNPLQFTTVLAAELYYIIYLIMIIGFAISVFYIVKISKYYDELRKIHHLISWGEKVKAKIIAIEKITDVKIGDIVPKVIICMNGDKAYISGKIWLKDIPERYINHYLYVYVDNENRDNYVVDYTMVV